MIQSHTSLIELGASIRSRRLSPVELLRACLERIDRFNGELNAIVTLDRERALADAAAIERRLAAGEDPGPLAGIPFAVKDLEDVAGMRTTFGSPLFADNVARADSINVARLRAAGAYPIGKANTPEFGAYMQTSNSVFGATRNPWNLDRTPGGSSGGSAAALVGGLVPLVTASDGGGSIRHPAAFTGCVGLKPTFRRVPQRPDPVLVFDDTVVWGPLTLTVRDAALIADVTFGPSEEDPCALPAPDASYAAALERRLAPLRIGFARDFDCHIQPDVAEAVAAAVRTVEQLGHYVEELPAAPPFCGKAWSLLGAVSEYVRHGDHLDRDADRLDPMIRAGLRRIREHAAADLAYVYRHRTALLAWASDVFARFDMLVMPTLPLEAFPIGIAHPTEIDGRAVRVHDAFPFTYPFNLTGHPALSLPAGMTRAGLPAAVQFVARRFREDLLLQIGRDFEAARPWPIAPPRYRAV
jgi:Asp-tRNA(Asn)/Glu-tRNA(Gln) amidotransferase A subunit family amidase